MVRKLFHLVFMFFLLVIPLQQEVEARDITVYVNGVKVAFDVQPMITEANRTIVPVRFISEQLGAKVSWNYVRQEVYLTRDEDQITLTVNDRRYTVNDVSEELDQPPILKDGRVLVPLRVISEAFGAAVEWIGETREIRITEGTMESVPNNGKKEEHKKQVVEKELSELVTSPRQQMIIFPEYWYSGAINGSFRSLTQQEANHYEKIMVEAMKKYPRSVINRYLDHVYLVKELSFFNVMYGGTYSGNTVYVSAGNAEWMYGDEFIESAFHHEFSSILWKENRDQFNESAWKRLNPAGFTYGNSGIDANIRGENSLRITDKSLQFGFLTQYSASALQEDINVFAENMFIGESKMWDGINRYENIRKKYELMVDFYQSIDPMFTDEYFRKMHQEYINKKALLMIMPFYFGVI